jgi:DNA-binding NarL/FixJ family response regulator
VDIRLLFASPDAASLSLLHSLLDSAQELTCFAVATAEARSHADLMARVDHHDADVILLDWPMAGPDTPQLVSEILTHNPQMRVVALLPQRHKQYRERVWQAGACNSIPKEHMDQEWLSSILCVMYRAMERECRLRAELNVGTLNVGATNVQMFHRSTSTEQG